jgi:hypothetical protein
MQTRYIKFLNLLVLKLNLEFKFDNRLHVGCVREHVNPHSPLQGINPGQFVEIGSESPWIAGDVNDALRFIF